MKYVADDGEIFKTAEECLEYEAKQAQREKIKARAERYLSLREYKNDGARRRALTVIMSWVDFDMKENPGRYIEEVEAPKELKDFATKGERVVVA